MKEVTVVIPNYNGMKYLPECMASLCQGQENAPEYENDSNIVRVTRKKLAGWVAACEEGFDMAARMCRVENGKVKVEIGKNGAVLWKTLFM